ncbi:hypothetical protein E2C01_092820 [Portunus trituberculatus]|uniref:Uncharacterized protein n=1 Tax=Portunus trituberculatus TaxID=210409 RepID=A0A5B7JN45_PORTR|nr:hypothetical protein [Portunus trituberculatus]
MFTIVFQRVVTHYKYNLNQIITTFRHHARQTQHFTVQSLRQSAFTRLTPRHPLSPTLPSPHTTAKGTLHHAKPPASTHLVRAAM